MFKSEQIRTIRRAYEAIPDLWDGFWNVKEKLLSMNDKAERQHRRGTPAGCVNPLSIKDAAKLFTVRHLLDGWLQPDEWTVDAILTIRNEVLYAQAYAKKHHKDLALWAVEWRGPFEQVDYAKLMERAA
jgi:hypothetical protein